MSYKGTQLSLHMFKGPGDISQIKMLNLKSYYLKRREEISPNKMLKPNL